MCADDYDDVISRLRKELSASIEMERALAREQVERVVESTDSAPVVEVVSSFTTTVGVPTVKTTKMRPAVRTVSPTSTSVTSLSTTSTSMVSATTVTMAPMLDSTPGGVESSTKRWMEEAVNWLTTSTPPPFLATLVEMMTTPSTGTVSKTTEVKKYLFLFVLFNVNFSIPTLKFYKCGMFTRKIPILYIKYN